MELTLMEKQSIEKQANAFLTQYGYSFEKDTYVDIVDFVQGLGFVVGNARLDDHEDGFLAIRPQAADEKVIGVNYSGSLPFKRFVIAHEFAHSVLHYKTGQAYLHRENKKGKNLEENDADYFAAALLMPAVSFRRMYDKFSAEGMNETAICFQLASIYKVPTESVARRIKEVCA